MKRASVYLLVLAAVLVSSITLGRAQSPRVIEIEGNDQMKFSVTSITASPGERLTVRLKAVGNPSMPKTAMAHNFVLLARGTDAMDFANKSGLPANAKVNYIAPELKDKVIAATALAGNGETVEVTFNAPKEPGNYTYLCSFPAHFAVGMRGTLTVK
jgi:azurin